MSDPTQVRINELARELEVKAKAIIDLLPGFGVTEKKTHSSSIPVDIADKVRHQLQGTAEPASAPPAAPPAAVHPPAPAPVQPKPAAPAPVAPVVPRPAVPPAA